MPAMLLVNIVSTFPACNVERRRELGVMNEAELVCVHPHFYSFAILVVGFSIPPQGAVAIKVNDDSREHWEHVGSFCMLTLKTDCSIKEVLWFD